MMKYWLTALSLMAVMNSAYADICDINPEKLVAEYTIVKNTQKGKQLTYPMLIWRDGQQVAREYPKTQITKFWEQTPNHQLRLVKYFDEQQRAIEYQPEEVKLDNVEAYWQKMYQIVSGDLLNEMTKISSDGEGCQLTEHYTLEEFGVKMKLAWLPNQKLVKSMQQETHEASTQWTLESINSDEKTVERAFAKRETYYATDFADIGDNESDPFLIKMMNLGHLDHGSSGFYDEHGHQIGSGHHH